MCHRPEPEQDWCQPCGLSPPLLTHGNRNTSSSSPRYAPTVYSRVMFPTQLCTSMALGVTGAPLGTPVTGTRTQRWTAGCQLSEHKSWLQGKCAAQVLHISPASGRAAGDNPNVTLPPVSTAGEERGISTTKTVSHYIPISTMPIKTSAAPKPTFR